MGWGSGFRTTTTWSLKNIRGQLAFHMAAAKAKTWKLLESEADESTKHSPVKADTVGNDNLENNKLCVLVPIHKPTDRFSINPWCSQRWFKTPDSFLFTSRRVFCHYSSVWAFHYWSTSTSYVASYKEIEIFTFWSSRKVWRFKKGETVNKFNSEVQGSPRNANMIDYGQKYSLERIIMLNNEATYSCQFKLKKQSCSASGYEILWTYFNTPPLLHQVNTQNIFPKPSSQFLQLKRNNWVTPQPLFSKETDGGAA